jgi:uncharacterized protein DUF4129
MRPRAYAIAGIAAVALALVMVASTVSSGSLLGAHHPRAPSEAPLVIHPHRNRPPAQSGEGIPRWFQIMVLVLLLLLLLALLVLLVMSRWGRETEDAGLELDPETPPPGSAWDEAWSVDLERATSEQLLALGRGAPRNAIIACWMGLQSATRAAGLPADRAETPEEFTVRAMSRLDLDRSAIGSLSALYREARFSAHLMGEGQRQEARRALGTLADQLSVRRAGSGPERALEQASR